MLDKMKILFISNSPRLECGVAELGRQHVAALRAAGHEVEDYAPQYPQECYTWLARAPEFDVVHVNYHPGTLGWMQPSSPRPRLLSAFNHELGSTYWFGKPDIEFSAETNLFMPVMEYAPQERPPLWLGTSVLRAGTSTYRHAGVDWAAPVLAVHGIDFDYKPDKKWLSPEDEIERLARCDFLIYWYPGANAGQSFGVSFGIAAQRPIILPRGQRMFSSLLPYEDELYFVDTIEEGIKAVMDDLRANVARVPRRAKKERSWGRAVQIMEAAWNAAAHKVS